ncbi:MAG: hypothetical protein CV089_01770 [Nitrospira sp. WS110]|nr:hypothetical protein [Nitrospira sp. WS110]
MELMEPHHDSSTALLRLATACGLTLLVSGAGLLQGCWKSEQTLPSSAIVGLPGDILRQTDDEVTAKNTGCVSCHTQNDAPTMHLSSAVRLACVDCHGGQSNAVVPKDAAPGSPVYNDMKDKAHVQPKYPDAWRDKDGNRSAANPQQSYTLLNKEDPQFIRFVNPGDLRVARLTCGACHQSEVEQVEKSPMTTSGVFWTAAAYNNGIVAQKTPFLGESYSIDGIPQKVQMVPSPSGADLAKGVLPFLLPLPRWEILPPGDIFRVFERGGINIPSNFPDIGTVPSFFMQSPSKEDPGRPDIRQSNRGPGTGLRIAVPVLNIHKTRLNDPHLSFLGTNDNPGDFRSSGCTACHVVYGNDRDPLHSGPYAKFGNRGESQTTDPTIPKKEPGHPLRHQLTKAIPTSQCMSCHMHQPNVFVNTYLGYTMWDYETDGEAMWPEKQKYPTEEEKWQSLNRNPEEAAIRGKWSDPEFLADVSKLNGQLKYTQFADYHGHGWNFRAVFKRDRKGNLLDDQGNVVSDVTSEKLEQAMQPRSEQEWEKGRPGIPVHLKDIHLEKGMHCADCHFASDSHGDGKLYGQYADAIGVTCADCHGTIREYATLKTSGPMSPPGGEDLKTGVTEFKQRRFEWRNGKLFQRSSVEKGKEWEVVQVKDTVDPMSDWSKAHPKQAEQSRLAKTMQKDGITWGAVPANETKLAHPNEEVACFSCHLSWTTSCAGCHLPIKANWKKEANHFEGEETRNWASYNPQVARDDQFILGLHGTVKRGGEEKKLIAPVRSSSALVLSSENANRERIYVQQPPVASSGYSSQAFAPHFPHTVRSTETKRCTDCHVSYENDNNAWLQQVLGQGTNFPNFIGRHAWVGEGKSGFEAVPVTEWDEPQAVIGSYLHKLAYPDYYADHLKQGREIPRFKDGRENAKHHGGKEIRGLQLRGEYLYTANGSDGFRVYDVANVDNKGFSENIVTAPVSPLGQRTYVKSRYATAVALPTTMPVSPSRQERPEFQKNAKGNQEQVMHPLYRYGYITDLYEGLIVVDVETLSDGDPDNNFLSRATTFNPDGVLNGATHITIAGHYAYVSCERGVVVVSVDDPMNPKVVADFGAAGLAKPGAVAIQFRYAFVLDEEGMKVVDVTIPESPRAVSGATLRLAGARDLYVARGYAYVAAGAEGLVIIDIEKPEQPRIDQRFTADGQINDAYSVRVGSTNASLFAYVADGKNGLRVVQLTSPPSQPNYYGFNPRPVPELVATYKTKGPAIALSKGLDRDRAVDESGHQVSIFGRLGSRPFNLDEQRQLYLRDGKVFTVKNDPPGPPEEVQRR